MTEPKEPLASVPEPALGRVATDEEMRTCFAAVIEVYADVFNLLAKFDADLDR